MSVFGQRYVIDTNALIQLGKRRRASTFFLENAVVPEEVLREAEGFPDIGSLRENIHPTTPRVLHWLAKVMSTVPDADTRLIDLYANRGNADPLVVACALEGQEYDNQYLGAPEWIVVTADDAVRAKAEEFGLKVLSNSQFAALIDGVEDDQGGHGAVDDVVEPALRFSADESYRTCAECGRDCEPEPFGAGEGQGIRIAFACPEHGVHSIVDPFEDTR